MPSWVTSWTGAVQGPYPVGNTSAQPDLRFALAEGAARDQTFRLIVRPSLWGRALRLRLSNAHGDRPVTFSAVHVGLQRVGSVVGDNRPVSFSGAASVTVPPGRWLWSDPVELPAAGQRLAVSLAVAGSSGPITWHAKALTTSYISPPGSGALGHRDGIAEFPYTTTSWYFLDAIDMDMPDDVPDARTIVCFGDSITDGTGSTLNGDDRWPDVLLQRLRAAGRDRVAIANMGIGGNQVIGPPNYDRPFPGGPSALDRLERDVLGLSGVGAVIWLEGINDLGGAGKATADQVIDGLKRGVGRLRTARPGVRIIGATVTGALGANAGVNHGDEGQDRQRQRLNAFIRTAGLYDAVADFDRATLDPTTGGLRPEFVPDSTIGGPGDGLHPNRAGYAAMAAAIDLDSLFE